MQESEFMTLEGFGAAPQMGAGLPAADQPFVPAAPAAPVHAGQGVIPEMNSPVSAEALLKDINVSFTIGADDVLEGGIKVGPGKSIIVRGRVTGSIECQGMVLIMREAKVVGNIVAGQCWVEGEILSRGEAMSRIDAGALHIGVHARVEADCIYDQLSVATPNRGLKGRLENRTPTIHG